MENPKQPVDKTWEVLRMVVANSRALRKQQKEAEKAQDK